MYTVAIKAIISTRYVQKAAAAHVTFGRTLRTVKVITAVVLVRVSSVCSEFHSAFDSDSKYLKKAQNCVIKYLHTQSLSERSGAKRHLRQFQ